MGDSNLNKLLEDALDDLLLEDAPAVSHESTSTEKAPTEDKTTKTKPKPKSANTMVDEQEMDRFFATMTEKLNSEMPKIDPSESVPQIMDLMQNLLSRELLYPALKDLAPKFEEWLKNNRTTLSKDERVRFKKQLSTIHKIIDVFDDESLEVRERFEKNLMLMEEMQTYGAPPEELTVPDGLTKCSIM